MDLEIRGKVALVTGASRGLGRQAALSLAAEGVNVAICGRTKSALDEEAQEIQSLGVLSVGVVADISDEAALKPLYEKVVGEMGQIDILVNNVGGSLVRADIMGTTLQEFRDTFDLNFFGSVELMKLVIPHMKKKRWGRIINIASIFGREQGGNVSYMSAKAGLIAATKHVAVSLAKDGVLVNSIAPGSITFPGGSWEKYQRDNSPEEVEKFIDNNLPMGRFGWPEPVGDLVAFLASERASLITGSSIVVDGGQSRSMI